MTVRRSPPAVPDFCRFSAVVQRGNQLNRFGQFLKVCLELGFHCSVEHCSSLSKNVIMQAALYGRPECNLHHGAGMKWARGRPWVAGWHVVYPAYDTVGQCKRSAARLTDLDLADRSKDGASVASPSFHFAGQTSLGETPRTERLSLYAAGQMHHGRYLQR